MLKKMFKALNRRMRHYMSEKRLQKMTPDMFRRRDFEILTAADEHLNVHLSEEAQEYASRNPPIFVQKVLYFDIHDRMNLFEYYCNEKKILHIGCTDYPIFDPQTNLHIRLSKLTSEIHGLDLDIEGLKVLKQYVDQPYFSSVADVTDTYDVVLVPEVIEHVDSVRPFLEDIGKINAKTFIITAPNAFSPYCRNVNYLRSGQLSVEVVHPDHNCYFSPFTLKNVIEKYSCMKVQRMFLINEISIACVCTAGGC